MGLRQELYDRVKLQRKLLGPGVLNWQDKATGGEDADKVAQVKRLIALGHNAKAIRQIVQGSMHVRCPSPACSRSVDTHASSDVHASDAHASRPFPNRSVSVACVRIPACTCTRPCMCVHVYMPRRLALGHDM